MHVACSTLLFIYCLIWFEWTSRVLVICHMDHDCSCWPNHDKAASSAVYSWFVLSCSDNLRLSHRMRKPTICIGENKAADQLRSNREADQRLCFRYTGSTIPLLHKSEFSSFWPASVTVQTGLCRTWLETTLLVFP